MKKYNILDLNVVRTIDKNRNYNYLICKYNFLLNSYIEIFTKKKIKATERLHVVPLCNYYGLLEICDKDCKPLMLTINDLFEKYQKINSKNDKAKIK